MTSFTPCVAPECWQPQWRREWCHGHYAKWRRYGDPLTPHKRAASTGGVTRVFKAQWIEEYKLARGCADCGYAAHPAALDFDHRPGTVKVRDIKSGQQLGWEALQAEVAKCDVVCANCHRIRTFTRGREVMPCVLIPSPRGRGTTHTLRGMRRSTSRG